MSACIKPRPGVRGILLSIGTRHKKNHQDGLRHALVEIGKEVTQLTAKYILGPPKTGRIYIINGRPHQASAPFESPAELTGKLRRSINFKVSGSRQLRVGETAYYAKWLEEGTRDNKILPRPHLIRAIRARQRKVVKIIEENVNRQLNR